MKSFCIFSVAFLLAGFGTAFAQDIIILRDGNMIDSKVTEISPTEIRYKRLDHLDGPTVVIPATSVLSIKYENGNYEIINAGPVAAGNGAIGTAAAPHADYIAFSDAGISSWALGANARLTNNSTANFTIGREFIEGREREVLTMEVKLANGNEWRLGQFSLQNPAMRQKLRDGSGVRFNVLGDGNKWILQLPTTEIINDTYYETTFSTKKGRVVAIDIPYSKLKQPPWGGMRVAFNKQSIENLGFQRNSINGGSGTSTIKVFDLEIY